MSDDEDEEEREYEDEEEREYERREKIYRMDFGVVKKTVAAMLDAGGWVGNYTVGADILDTHPFPHYWSRFALSGSDQGIAVVQPSMGRMNHGEMIVDEPGKIKTPYGEGRYTHENINIVFRCILGEFIAKHPLPSQDSGREKQEREKREQERRAEEGRERVRQSVDFKDGRIEDLVDAVRANGHEIARGYGLDLREADRLLRDELERRVHSSAAWHG